jgi:hypothetical protein
MGIGELGRYSHFLHCSQRARPVRDLTSPRGRAAEFTAGEGAEKPPQVKF